MTTKYTMGSSHCTALAVIGICFSREIERTADLKLIVPLLLMSSALNTSSCIFSVCLWRNFRNLFQLALESVITQFPQRASQNIAFDTYPC